MTKSKRIIRVSLLVVFGILVFCTFLLPVECPMCHHKNLPSYKFGDGALFTRYYEECKCHYAYPTCTHTICGVIRLSFIDESEYEADYRYYTTGEFDNPFK